MSKYTTEVRYIVEMNSPDNYIIGDRINESLPRIFNFDYPIWSEDYRRVLERKIIMHYFNKEIAFETVGLWKLYLEERLNLIMPYYNEMYKTVATNFDWLINVNTTETFDSNKLTNGNVVDNSTGSSKNTGKDTATSNVNETTTGNNNKTLRSLKSDLPQANYGGIDYGTDLQEDEATDNRTDTHTATSTSEVDKNDIVETKANSVVDSSAKTMDTYSRIIKGLSGSRSATELNMEFRNSLINIDKMIIDELYDLFMLIY